VQYKNRARGMFGLFCTNFRSVMFLSAISCTAMLYSFGRPASTAVTTSSGNRRPPAMMMSFRNMRSLDRYRRTGKYSNICGRFLGYPRNILSARIFRGPRVLCDAFLLQLPDPSELSLELNSPRCCLGLIDRPQPFPSYTPLATEASARSRLERAQRTAPHPFPALT
jgi:hypothetical protein